MHPHRKDLVLKSTVVYTDPVSYDMLSDYHGNNIPIGHRQRHPPHLLHIAHALLWGCTPLK